MTRTISLFAVAAIGVALAAPAWAATDAECQDMWKRADTNSDGVLSDRESLRYVALMRNGFDAPPDALLRKFLGIDPEDPRLVDNAVRLLGEKVAELERLARDRAM